MADVDDEVAHTLGVDSAPRRRWPWAVAGTVLVVLVAATALWPRGPDMAYDAAVVERGALEVSVSAVGTLEPLHAVSVSSDVSGVVQDVRVDTNDKVEKDQVLAELDTAMLAAQVREARARVAAAKASLDQARIAASSAERERDRADTLHRQGAIADRQRDEAHSAYAQAVASVGVAEAQLAQSSAALGASRLSLDRSTIRAPIAGVVLQRNIEPGQAVVSALQAQTLFTVAEDLSRMEVEVEVDEADVGKVHAGQQATFTVAAWPGREFEAVVHKVELAPRSNPGDVVTYEACLHVDNAGGQLRPGMTASAEIVAHRVDDALLVPNAAMRFAPDGTTLEAPPTLDGRRQERVWVLQDGVPTPRFVVTGATDGRRSIVESGLAPGEQVVLAEKEAK